MVVGQPLDAEAGRGLLHHCIGGLPRPTRKPRVLRQEEPVLSRAFHVTERPELRIITVTAPDGVGRPLALREALAAPLNTGQGMLLQITSPTINGAKLQAALISSLADGASRHFAVTVPAEALQPLVSLDVDLGNHGFCVGFFSDHCLVDAMSHALRHARLQAMATEPPERARRSAAGCPAPRRRVPGSQHPPRHQSAWRD